MAPTDLFHQRSGSNGEWLPPRPLHSNRLIYGYTTGVWYAYHNWSTTLVDPPDPRTVTEYKTFSFYMNNQSFWIYPEDAVRNKVGDGTGNARISQGDDSEESGSSDEPYDEGNPRVQDWAPLTFHYPIPRDTTGTSYAAARNAPHSTLNLQRPDQRALSQLLPDRYKAPADRRRAPIPWGGMVGDLPILIALIAFSVSPDRVDHYLRHCLRAAYQPHTRPRGEGCKHASAGFSTMLTM